MQGWTTTSRSRSTARSSSHSWTGPGRPRRPPERRPCPKYPRAARHAPALPPPDACDVDSFIERVGGDTELARELAVLFIPDAIRLVGAIRDAVDAAEPERLRQEAHALKGAAGNFGAARVVAASLDLEMMGKAGDLSRSKAVLASLEEDASQLVEALRLFAETPSCAS